MIFSSTSRKTPCLSRQYLGRLHVSQDSLPRKTMPRKAKTNAAGKNKQMQDNPPLEASQDSPHNRPRRRRTQHFHPPFCPLLTHAFPPHSAQKRLASNENLLCTVVPVYSSSLTSPMLLRCPPGLPLGTPLLRQPLKYTKTPCPRSKALTMTSR
jgi:hypothetical protein